MKIAIKDPTKVLMREKAEILDYVYKNPNCCSNQVNNHLLTKYKSKKTTSTIFKYVCELISSGYLIDVGKTHKKLSITRKGKNLLDTLYREHVQDSKNNLIINLIIVSCESCRIGYRSLHHFHSKCGDYGGL
ncbi:hypothetical protein CEE45_07650 [Candidatus Heimdallarchaeota archaeon B3_Heim]|nr:MAG: hypothetical protein CEE45_07650 [Candidatus Heimdallarchaeota archaeon B3_Heim]